MVVLLAVLPFLLLGVLAGLMVVVLTGLSFGVIGGFMVVVLVVLMFVILGALGRLTVVWLLKNGKCIFDMHREVQLEFLSIVPGLQNHLGYPSQGLLQMATHLVRPELFLPNT